MVRFHGACSGCTIQELHGIDFCVNCQNFDVNWDLPDLNNRVLSEREVKKIDIKSRLKPIIIPKHIPEEQYIDYIYLKKEGNK